MNRHTSSYAASSRDVDGVPTSLPETMGRVMAESTHSPGEPTFSLGTEHGWSHLIRLARAFDVPLWRGGQPHTRDGLQRIESLADVGDYAASQHHVVGDTAQDDGSWTS